MRVSLDLEITGMQKPDRKVCVEIKKMYFHFVVPILKTNTSFLVLFYFTRIYRRLLTIRLVRLSSLV